MTTGDRYSGISLALLRSYRTVLLRRTEPEGKSTWSAEVGGIPGLRATGATRIEALSNVKGLLASSRGGTQSPARIVADDAWVPDSADISAVAKRF